MKDANDLFEQLLKDKSGEFVTNVSSLSQYQKVVAGRLIVEAYNLGMRKSIQTLVERFKQEIDRKKKIGE